MTSDNEPDGNVLWVAFSTAERKNKNENKNMHFTEIPVTNYLESNSENINWSNFTCNGERFEASSALKHANLVLFGSASQSVMDLSTRSRPRIKFVGIGGIMVVELDLVVNTIHMSPMKAISLFFCALFTRTVVEKTAESAIFLSQPFGDEHMVLHGRGVRPGIHNNLDSGSVFASGVEGAGAVRGVSLAKILDLVGRRSECFSGRGIIRNR